MKRRKGMQRGKEKRIEAGGESNKKEAVPKSLFSIILSVAEG